MVSGVVNCRDCSTVGYGFRLIIRDLMVQA